MPPEGSLAVNGPYDPLPSYYKPFVGILYRDRIERTLALLEGVPFRSVLEIGYGSGVLLPTLCAIAPDVTAIDRLSDPRTASERLSRLGCSPRLLRCEAERMRFPAGRFDLVVSISTFEHIPGPRLESAARLILKSLRPGGHLLAGIPAVNGFMDRTLSLIGYPSMSDHHVTRPRDVFRILSAFLEPVRHTRMPSFLPDPFCFYHSYLFRKPAPSRRR
jgi:SAM-dependent methyltransferase